MDMLKRHLNCHTDETYRCQRCKYTSPRRDAIRRHTSRQKTDKDLCRPTMELETKPYQANPSPVNSYLYQQTMPKYKEAFHWTLHELDTLQSILRPYHIKVPIIIPHEAEIQIPDPRPQPENTIEETTSISSEKDRILKQEFEIPTLLSELNYMLRQLEADETVPPPKYTEEETKAWPVLDSFGTIAMVELETGGTLP